MRKIFPYVKALCRRDGFTGDRPRVPTGMQRASGEVAVGGADSLFSKPALLPFVRLAGQRDGFTLLEMLVVVSVVTMLAGVMVIYSRTSENQIILFKEQAKAVNAFFQAKTFALQTFSEDVLEKPCAYGLALDDTTHALYLFKDIPTDFADCATADKQFAGVGSDEVVSIIPFDARVVVSVADTDFEEVLFTPPDPTTLLNKDPLLLQPVQLVLKTPDLSTALGVKISDAGQITAIKL